jgi:hypothetical protein
MAVYYYQYSLYMYDLCMFIRHLVSITQVLKDLGLIIGVTPEIYH